jgi:hypothetical protein
MPLRSLHTCMCVYYSESSTQLCVAATLLLLPGAGTNESDRPLGLIVVTRTLIIWLNEQIELETLHGAVSLKDPL